MARKGSWQKGQFNVRDGMVFTMPDMPLIFNDKPEMKTNAHPWLVLREDDDYIEIIMCTTLTSESEGKHRMHSLNYDDVTDIRNPCPPMDAPGKRMSKVSLNTFRIMPKKDLFSHSIKIWNENTPSRNFKTEGLKSLCLNKEDLKFIRKEVLDFISDHSEFDYDPLNIEEKEAYLYDLENESGTPEWAARREYNERFGWKNIKAAEPEYAVYPFEDQMHDYEKTDPKLMEIARLKKNNSKYRKPKHTQTNQKQSKGERIRQTKRIMEKSKEIEDKAKENSDNELKYT